MERREHGDGHADAKTEDGQHHDGERWRSPETAERDPNIVAKSVHWISVEIQRSIAY
jgi:hypothetical protein